MPFPDQPAVYAIALTAVCAGTDLLRAEDWPHWRGPSRSGISAEQLPPEALRNIGGKRAWTTEVGTGFSSVSVAGDRLFTAGHEKGKNSLFCLRTGDGALVWKYSFEADLGDKFYEGGPGATPVVAGGRVYHASKWGKLLCLDSDTGKVVWKKNLCDEAEVRVPTWGFNGSPLVIGNTIYLNVGSAGMALHRDNGAILWQSARGNPGYCTPVLHDISGTRVLLLASANYYLAVDPGTGKRLWSHRWVTRYGVNAADPIAHGSQVFISSGYNKGCSLLEIAGQEVKTIWKSKALRNQFSGSILLDGYLYGIDGDSNGQASLKCLEWKTGEEKWNYPENGFGSLVATRSHLLVLDHEGTLRIAPASPKGFTPTSSAQILDGRCWTAPVLANQRLYARNASGTLVCITW